MSRNKTGEAIQWRVHMKTWVGRVRGYPADAPRGRWLTLGTDDKGLAQKRYEQWLATGEPPREANEEKFGEAAERIVDAMGEKDNTARRKKLDRRTRLRQFALPIMGQVEVWRVEPHHVASVLDRLPKLGKLKGTILKLRSDISQVLAALVREGAITLNPARALPLPVAAVEDGRLRQVLTDGELVRFREKRGFDTELDMAMLVCRDLAGHRTSDILAARIEHIDFARHTWKVRRPKTDSEGQLVTTRRIKSYELVEHDVPDHVYGPLAAWVKKLGKTDGPLFPVQRAGVAGKLRMKGGKVVARRGSAVGDQKANNGNSYSAALRRALWAAGIYRPLQGFNPKKPDKALCALQTDTAESRRADFHSVRRAFVTALKASGMTTADVLAASGHTQLATSSRYDAARRVQVPAGAFPGAEPPTPPTPAVDGHAAILEQLEALKALVTASKSVPTERNHSAIPAYDPQRGSKDHSAAPN